MDTFFYTMKSPPALQRLADLAVGGNHYVQLAALWPYLTASWPDLAKKCSGVSAKGRSEALTKRVLAWVRNGQLRLRSTVAHSGKPKRDAAKVNSLAVRRPIPRELVSVATAKRAGWMTLFPRFERTGRNAIHRPRHAPGASG